MAMGIGNSAQTGDTDSASGLFGSVSKSEESSMFASSVAR